MKRLDTTPTLYTPARADALAAMLNASDDEEWGPMWQNTICAGLDTA